MKRILFILLLMVSAVAGYSQVMLPQGNPNPSSTGYMRYGYVRADSGIIVPIRDTTFLPVRPMLVRKGDAFYYYDMIRWNKLYTEDTDSSVYATLYRLDTAKQNLRNELAIKVDSVTKGANDSVFVWRNGIRQFSFIDNSTDTASLSNRINLKLNISDTAAMLSGLMDTAYRISGVDSIYFKKRGGALFAIKDSAGSDGYISISQIDSLSFRLNRQDGSGDTVEIDVVAGPGGGGGSIDTLGITAKGVADFSRDGDSLRLTMIDGSRFSVRDSVGLPADSVILNRGTFQPKQFNVDLGRLNRLILNKDSVPITTSSVWGLTVDTVSGRVQRRQIVPSWSLTGNAINETLNFIGTTNNQDVIIRRNSVQVARFGTNSLLMGPNAGANSTAVNLIAIGLNAATNAANSDNAVVIGVEASQNVSNSTHMVAIGRQAGSSNSDHSVLIGFQAGRPLSGNIIGANNIIIGSRITLPNGFANRINIGGVIFGNGVNSNQPLGFPITTPADNPQVSIGIVTPAASALLDLTSTTRGVLFPRVSTTQQNAITGPATGLMVYNTTDSTLTVHTNAWRNIPNGIKASAVLDFPSTGPHASSDLTVSVPGAEVGDIVQVGSTVNPANSNWSAFVSATDVVTVRYNHYGDSTNDPASATFKIYVIKN